MNSIVFLVVIPLIAAFLSLFLGNLNKITMYIVTLFNLIFSISVFMSGKIPFNVAIGGWKAPFGINFVVTDITIYFLLLVNIAALMSITMVKDIKEYQFYSFYFVLLAATNGMVLTGDMFNFYLFTELSTFAIAGLVAYKRDRLSTGAALKFLILSSTASLFSLSSIGLIYKTLGTLNFADIALKLTKLNQASYNLILILFLASMLVELKIFPFNLWVVKSYEGSITSVNMFTHGMLGTAGIYGAIRILLIVFPNMYNTNISKVLVILSVFTVLIGEIGALKEKNLVKVLAFSSMAQMGIFMFGIALGSFESIKGSLYIVVSNYLAKLVMFIVTKQYSRAVDSKNYIDMKGLGRKYPILAISFTIAALSLMGMPFFAGFWGKFSIVISALSLDRLSTLGIAIILIASVIEGVYYLRISHTFFVEKDVNSVNISRVYSIIPFALALLILVVGIYPNSIEQMLFNVIDEIKNAPNKYINIILSLK
ncbi:complex I subunit 5 family protein [Caloramator proteoclasticus]|uniref:Multicomponent Na+:H+ antiporter subunit D n=1 Tax=Caloramator proteoclasticus DSM 10124 TaxID=1121262 RepID=A0A1M4TT59_9CLOT|nr:proton-conducting transporter membrane subunit [Caloramator proteoclasticus]SHE47596.1 multicomponent Na+:H+ antiporter subunit D [Caloramator proteoclasticus DSM 10124]